MKFVWVICLMSWLFLLLIVVLISLMYFVLVLGDGLVVIFRRWVGMFLGFIFL